MASIKKLGFKNTLIISPTNKYNHFLSKQGTRSFSGRCQIPQCFPLQQCLHTKIPYRVFRGTFLPYRPHPEERKPLSIDFLLLCDQNSAVCWVPGVCWAVLDKQAVGGRLWAGNGVKGSWQCVSLCQPPMTVGPRQGGQINNQRASKAQSHALKLERENRKTDRRKLRNKMTQRAEASGEGNEFGQVPMICCTAKREGEMLLVVTVWIKMSPSLHPSSFISKKEVHCLFVFQHQHNPITCDGYWCCCRETIALQLFTVSIDFWILQLQHFSLR